MSKKKRILYGSALAVIVIAIALVVIVSASGSAETVPAPVSPEEPALRSNPVQLIEVEKTITTEMISERLREIGLLVTEEYAFTEVVSFSSVKTLWNIDLPFTESSYLASYDGVVTAGIDFSGIRVEKDEELRRVTIYLPRPKVLSVDIDPKSFQLYSEKEGLWNRISVTDFNDSLIELEENARTKALEKGVLEHAGANARRLIDNLVGSLIDTSEYSVLFLYA